MPRPVWSILSFCVVLTILAGTAVIGQTPNKQKDPKNTQTKPPANPPVPAKQPEKKPPSTPLPPPADIDPPGIDTTTPSNPLDLVHGLRENGQSDLALEYLNELARRPLSSDVKSVLPLESALTRLEVAADESDDTKRQFQVSRARQEFETFIAANPSHPRAVDAAIALARATSLQARILLNRALKLPAAGDKDRAAAALARPIFDDASKKFVTAAKQIEEQLQSDRTSAIRKYELTRELHQAQLEAGVTRFEQSRTYIRPSGAAEVTARSDALKKAREEFKGVANRDPNNPYSWSARAWEAECEFAMQNNTDGERIVAQIRNDSSRYPAAREGIRMVRYFEVVRKYQSSRSPQELFAARTLAERWLSDFRQGKPTREQFAVMYYIPFLRKEEAVMTGVKLKKEGDKTKIESIASGSAQQLRIAEREYRKLLEYETDYSERAARDRTQIIRYLIGDKPKPPAEYKSFEEAHMAGLVELSEALQDETLSPEKRTNKIKSAAEYFERAVAISTPKDSAKDLLDCRVQLTYSYLQGGDPQKAATIGENLARTARSPSSAARAGVIALQAYLTPPPPAAMGMAENDQRQALIDANREKALALATYLEKTYPTEPATDAVRNMLGSLLYRSGQYLESFRVLSRITPAFPGLASARLTEGAAAFQVLRDGAKITLTPAERTKLHSQVTADLKAVPEPSRTAEVNDVRQFLWCRQQLIEIDVTDSNDGARRALAETQAILAKIPTFSSLPPQAQKLHLFDLERLRLQAISAQATPFFNAGKWSELSRLLDPEMAAMTKEIRARGTATKQAETENAKPGGDPNLATELTASAERLDKMRRERLVFISLQGKIRAGETGQTGDLVALMELLGGNLDAHASTLAQLIAVVKQQATGLRREGKTEEADRLLKATGDLFLSFASKPKLPEKYVYFAGKSLIELGRPADAAELLVKLPDASEADLRGKFADLSEEKKSLVRTHRSAKLELAKAYRLSNQLDKADAILKAALGADEKSPGWAAKVIDYRKEAILLTEARAAAETDTKKMNTLWATANRDWGKLGREYYSVLVQPFPMDEEKRKELALAKDRIKPIYFGIIADNQRCLIQANTMILKGKPEALEKRFDNILTTIMTIEKQNPDLSLDVREKFASLLEEAPSLKAKYIASGGTMFNRNPDGSLPTTMPTMEK
ncbi:MAG: hypothetical protein U0798_04655 [Gemmataceae bacterium]